MTIWGNSWSKKHQLWRSPVPLPWWSDLLAWHRCWHWHLGQKLKKDAATTKTLDYKNHFKKHLSQHRFIIFQRPTTHGLCWWLSLLPSRQNNLLWIEKIGWYICINDIFLWYHYDIKHVLHSQAWTETCLYHIIDIHRVYETKIQERQVEDRI